MKQILDSLLESEALGRLVTSAHGHNVLRSMLLRASAPRVQSLVAFFLEGGVSDNRVQYPMAPKPTNPI